MRAAIIGGGIGGLAAAVALRRVGIEAVVAERAAGIREVGAGLSLWSNAVNALRELGLADQAIAAGSVFERSTSQTPRGRVITTTDLGEISRMAGVPSVCIHRADLLRILSDALREGTVRTSARCSGFEGSAAILDNGERIEADLLIGADGIGSVVRERLHGASEPRYAGYTCLRGIAEDRSFLPNHSTLLTVGAGTQFGLFPCGPGRVYWFLTRNAPSGTGHSKGDALRICRAWPSPIPEVIEATPEGAIIQNDIIDRRPLGHWGRGRVTLLGDAAHATTPNLGQGACMALEDAVVLAHCLHTIQHVEAALREYERLRIPRTTMVVTKSWQSGRMFQLDQPALEAVRNWFFRTSLAGLLGMRMFRDLLLYRVPAL